VDSIALHKTAKSSRASQSHVKVCGDKPFDDHNVKPAAIKARMFFIHANLTKSMFATERATGLIERKDTR
jgi:hypothetical protein